jgi:hypothetical protein
MDGYAGVPIGSTADQSVAEELALATRRVMYQRHPHHLLSFERGGIMREHIETLIVALSDAMRGTAHHTAPAEPRRRRPRVARSTYVPVRRELATARFAH